MVGAADPFQLFRIMHEVVKADALRPEAGVAFMLDQCHNIEPKIPGQIRSVMNVQEATAKALLVDRPALEAAQRSGDVLGANAVLMDAYNTDVRPLLGRLRERMGLDPDPMAAYARSGLRRPDRRGAGRRQPGRLGCMSVDAASPEPGAPRPVAPARRGPAQHELRGRQHVGQGHGHRPGDRGARRPAVGQGLGR